MSYETDVSKAILESYAARFQIHLQNDVVVAGAGPAGLAAALTLWKRGHGVIVAEAASEPGGIFRSAPLSPGKEMMERPFKGFLKLVQREETPVLRKQ